MPANEMMVPSHASLEKRSPRNSIAATAVKIGLALMMKLAGPAETVSSPKLSSDGIEPDEHDAAECEAPCLRP